MAGYRWARVDTDYLWNPKIRGLEDNTDVVLHLASILRSTHHLTDGHVSGDMLAGLTADARASTRRTARRVEHLVDAGLWIPNGDGWYLHDFESMNPQAMRDVVERDRKASRERQRAWRERHNGVTGEGVTA